MASFSSISLYMSYVFISSMVRTFLGSSTLYVEMFLLTEKPVTMLVSCIQHLKRS